MFIGAPPVRVKLTDIITAIKPGPKPKKKDGTLDRRRRDNKDTPSNHPSLKPSKKK